MASVCLRNVHKTYLDKAHRRETPAVRDLSLNCEDGEFLVLLGPSGCGKTSTLRMIAGLENINSGTVHIGDQCVNLLSPRERNIAMAFENYALYPPLNVRENLIFPLKARGCPPDEIEKKLKSIVDILELGDILDRRPGELSGGQQQRISLGRCIIRDADVYLLDEPLSHLDSELRLRTRGELKRIHALYRRTMIYVTHDQLEALALADRIAIMNDGTLQQIGAPREVFEQPVNLFVAGFIGEPPMNFIDGKVLTEDDAFYFAPKDSKIRIPLPVQQDSLRGRNIASEIVFGIRPHHLSLGREGDLPNFNARVEGYESLGEEGVLEVDVCGIPLIVLTEPDLHIKGGDEVLVSLDVSAVLLFDKESGRSLPQGSATN